MSCQPCGCDPEVPHVCLRHLQMKAPPSREDYALKDEVDKKIKEMQTPKWIVPPPQEVRVTDPLTGGQKGQKLQRFSLIPPEFLWQLAEHYGKGAFKYADRNWEKGYKWSLTVDAMERHWNQFKMGERYDPETKSHHLIAAAWHVVALFIYDVRGLGTNDVTKPLDHAPQ
jgi:hypothetical protein